MPSSGTAADCTSDNFTQGLVLGDDVDLVALVAEPADHGGDDVVGLEAGAGVDRHAGIADHLEDALLLGVEVVGDRGAVGLVLRENLLAEHALVAAFVDDHGQVVGLALVDEVHEHLGEDEGGLGRLARRAGQFAERGEVGAEDLGVAVDDVEGLGHVRL